ncbi:hypothetical protein [Burkholderia vietnamiensis]|uniref:hypothetical protein n=1 Tax=Burkholderia vietnamiensis TaxID=60552 RepID=UPI0012D86591|nr:hypothetical protein [Burkholderia vietnamiensis]
MMDMKIDRYDHLQALLLSGQVEACRAFLASRYEADKSSVEYWYWVLQTNYRSGRFLEALDIGFKLMREARAFGMYFHCLVDICAHLGVKDLALSALDILASRPEFDANTSHYIRLAGYHYLGEDDMVQSLPCDASTNHAYLHRHFRARSLMRCNGIAAAVGEFHDSYCSHQALAELFPDQDATHYWCGQRQLPASLRISGISSGFGDFVQWIRYGRALQALGVKIHWDEAFNSIGKHEPLNEHDRYLAGQLERAGFAHDREASNMWTTPFALFSSLFPILGYASSSRYLAPRQGIEVQQLASEIRRRARGRKCMGIFWSSCESNNLYAARSLTYEQLSPLWETRDDIYWLVMQRGHERARWMGDPHSSDEQLCINLPENFSLSKTIGILDLLDGFVGNDGVLAHASGALGKPGNLLLNAACSDWRYEQSSGSSPWYSNLNVMRANKMGAWPTVVAKLSTLLSA